MVYKNGLVKYKIASFFFLIISLLPIIISEKSSAITTIPKSKYEIIARFENSNYMTQGGVVTKDYYVFTDCGVSNAQSGTNMKKYGNTRHCTNSKYNLLHIIDRHTCQQKTVKFGFGYISGIALNDWNSNTITFGSKKECMRISNGSATKVKSCKTASRNISTGVSNSTQQGLTTEFNGYLYKVSGTTKQAHPIAVVNKKTKAKKLYKLQERIGEPEQISIDGGTGEVYLAYNKGHKKGKKISNTLFIRIDASVFQKYTGKNKKTDTPTCKGYNKPVANSHSSANSDIGSSSNPPNSSGAPTTDSSTAESQFDGEVCTNLFGCFKDNGSGCGVYMILNFILDILSFGVVIAAVIGITLSGITYLTAGDNEQKTTKAKRKILEVVIGLVAYAVLYALINFLLPGGKLNTSQTCAKTTSYNQELDSRNFT